MAKDSPQDLKNREFFSSNLNRIMKEKRIRQIDLHNALNIPKSTITGYVKGRSMPTFGNIQKIADYLNVKKSELDPRFSLPIGDNVTTLNNTSTTIQEDTDTSNKILHLDRKLEEPRRSEWISNGEKLLEEQNIEGNNTNTVRNNVVQFPTKDDFESLIVHGLESAGDGIWQEDETDIEVRIPKSKIPEVFDDLALVIGDSMRPKLHNGDILFVTFTKQIEIGQIGVFRTSKGNFVKKLQPDRLESLNPDYEDIYFAEDEFAEAIGVVQDIYRK